MSQRCVMRNLRKEMLILQSAQQRMAVREALQNLQQGANLLSPARSEQASLPWLDALTSVLGVALPARWGRWFNAALGAWRIARRVADSKMKA